VRLRGGATPVLYLDDPPGVSKTTRRQMLDAIVKLDKMKSESYGDPEIETRISQYEMAYRMQTSVPDLMDLSKEPDSVFEMYGPESRKPGTYAANCLLARRLAERGVRFIQLYHRGWDQHGDLPRDLALQCRGTDQPTAALVQDLKQRGLLDDTLVIWGGEFGRTVYCQGKLTEANYGVIITRAISRCGSPAAASRKALRSARPTITATTSSQTLSASSTCRRRCCICWASITNG